MRIALGLEYDGSAFCGWQTQPNGCGIQDHLQAALASIAVAEKSFFIRTGGNLYRIAAAASPAR